MSYCGISNLLIGEVFGCILSLFMGVSDQRLPTDEEVIVCDENTTAEEVNNTSEDLQSAGRRHV